MCTVYSESCARSASLIHRPILFSGVFTLGLSRKALPCSCEALLKPAQRFCPGASLRNEPRAENTRGLEYWRKHSVILERRGPRSAGEIESDTPTSCFRFFPLLPQQNSILNVIVIIIPVSKSSPHPRGPTHFNQKVPHSRVTSLYFYKWLFLLLPLSER